MHMDALNLVSRVWQAIFKLPHDYICPLMLGFFHLYMVTGEREPFVKVGVRCV